MIMRCSPPEAARNRIKGSRVLRLSLNIQRCSFDTIDPSAARLSLIAFV